MVYLHRVGSTNDVAKRLAEYGAPDGTLVLADVQTSGRGRYGRTWHSPEGGIYASLILRIVKQPDELPKLTIVTAIGACEGLRQATSLPIMVKWVNDLVLDGKKVGGILIEAKSSANTVEFVVVGIGVNVNVASFPDEIKSSATSLSEASGGELKRELLTASMLLGIERRYEELIRGEFDGVIESFDKLHFARGKVVEVSVGSQRFIGRVEGLGEGGELILLLEGGEIVKVTDGTMRVIG